MHLNLKPKNKYLPPISLLSILLIIAASTGCSREHPPAPKAAEPPVSVASRPVVLTSISIDPEADTMAIGSAMQLIATAHYSDGTQQELNLYTKADPALPVPRWHSSDDSVISVNPQGMVMVHKSGLSQTITLTYGKQIGKAVITPITTELVSITPSMYDADSEDEANTTIRLHVGERRQLIALGEYSDDSKAALKGAKWESSDDHIAKVSSTGEITAIRAGVVDLSATTNRIEGKNSAIIEE